MDTISDYLVRLRNALKAQHRVVDIPASNTKKAITEILMKEGYILNYKFVDEGPQGAIKIALKYHPMTKSAAIKYMERVSKPSLRKYVSHKDLPRVLNGLGIAMMSTSQGIMTNKHARDKKLGGEVLFYLY